PDAWDRAAGMSCRTYQDTLSQWWAAETAAGRVVCAEAVCAEDACPDDAPRRSGASAATRISVARFRMETESYRIGGDGASRRFRPTLAHRPCRLRTFGTGRR